jgi:lipoyl(octanoyl) transferase
VYVADTKFASVGLRIRRGASYHGMALNVKVDLEPFLRINPCGYAGLEMTDLAALGGDSDLDAVSRKLLPHFLRHLRLEDANVTCGPPEL